MKRLIATTLALIALAASLLFAIPVLAADSVYVGIDGVTKTTVDLALVQIDQLSDDRLGFIVPVFIQDGDGNSAVQFVAVVDKQCQRERGLVYIFADRDADHMITAWAYPQPGQDGANRLAKELCAAGAAAVKNNPVIKSNKPST